MRNWLKWLIPIGLIGYIYYPAFVWAVARWSAKDSYFGHGFLVPLVTLYWIVNQRRVVMSCEKMSDRSGILLLAVAGFLQMVAGVLRIYFLSVFSFVALLFGGVWLLFGRKLLREIWYPIAFLFMMIPLPLLVVSQVTLSMKFFVSKLAVSFLNSVGISALQLGSYIQMPHATILIGDPCSGLRSFLAFLCLGLVFAYSEKLNLWKKLVLVFLGFPLAIFSNVVRVFGLAFLSEIYGEEFISGRVHDASGYVVFIFAFLIFLVIRRKLELFHVQSE